jgi:hypothetical protein
MVLLLLLKMAGNGAADALKKGFAADKDGALAAANLAGKDLVAAVKKGTAAAKDGAVAVTKNLLKLVCCYCSRWQPMALLQLLKNKFILLEMVLFLLSKMQMLKMGSCCYRWLVKHFCSGCCCQKCLAKALLQLLKEGIGVAKDNAAAPAKDGWQWCCYSC